MLFSHLKWTRTTIVFLELMVYHISMVFIKCITSFEQARGVNEVCCTKWERKNKPYNLISPLWGIAL